MNTTYNIIVIGLIILLFVTCILVIFFKNKLIAFLHRFFQGYFFLIAIYLFFNIGLQLLSQGNISISDSSIVGSDSHHSKGYNVPVTLNVSFTQKKIYRLNTKSGEFTFTKNDNPIINELSEKSEIHKKMLEEIGLSKKQLDSIFEYSKDIEIVGKKLSIGEPYQKNKYLETNTSSFQTKTYLNIKSENKFFKVLQILKNYFSIIFLLIIFYQFIIVFKFLKQEIKFNKYLSYKIKWIGILFILWQLIETLLSFSFGLFYNYVGFENFQVNEGFQLSIYPRIEFDATLFLLGICLLVLNTILERANTIQTENDLTI